MEIDKLTSERIKLYVENQYRLRKIFPSYMQLYFIYNTIIN